MNQKTKTMSKELFTLMREKEIATANHFPTKKEIKNSAESLALSIIDSGDFNLESVYAQALRLKEAISIIEATIKNSLPLENFENYGLKAIYRSGGDSVNYSDDLIWSELKAQITHRESLLKVALKSDVDFYDEEGVKVPKVSTTPRKSSLAVTY